MSKYKCKVLLASCLTVMSLGVSASDVDPMACSDEELQAYVDSYKEGLKNHIAMTHKPDYNQIKQADIARRVLSEDSDSGEREAALCAIITTPDFDLSKLIPDLDFVTDAYSAMQAWYATDSIGGVDYATVISEGISAGMAYAMEKAREGYCKLANKLPNAIDTAAYDLYETAKKEGKSVILANEDVKALGVTNFKDPVWQQMAGEELDKQLGDYSDYAKWYEEGWSVEDAIGGVTEREVDDAKDGWLDHLESTDPLLEDGVPYL